VTLRGAAAMMLVVVTSATIGCGKDARAPVGIDDDRAGLRTPTAESAVTGWSFASVGDRLLGPVSTRRGAGPGAAGMIGWVSSAEGNFRRIIVLPTDARGAPRGSETVVAAIPIDTTMFVVKPMRGPSPGFVLAWTSLTDRGKALSILAIDDAGVPRGKAVELARTTDDIVWVDVVPTDRGAVCLWAEETRSADANVVAAPLDPNGHVRGTATRVAQGVIGWHALPLSRGFGLSTVAAAAPSKGEARAARKGSMLAFQRLDDDAAPIGPSQAITPQATPVSGDVEVVSEGGAPGEGRGIGRVVFAWTDRSGSEPHVTIAGATEKSVEPPRRLTGGRGGASLLSLVRGPAGIGALYETPTRMKTDPRRVHLARITPELAIAKKPLTIDVVARSQVELAATATGFALVATTGDCGSCAEGIATVIRTDADGAIVQRELLMFLTDPASHGWGLSCDGDTCFTLAASPGPPGTPPRMRTTTVKPRANAPAPPQATAAAPATGPRVLDVTAIATGESVFDLATTRIGDATVAVLLTSKSDGKKGDAGSSLTTRIIGESGEPSAPAVLSNRALAVGGVAIAGAEKPEDGGAVAWVARENGDPEVHVTRIDRRGRRMNDIQLTTTKGDATNVTITWAGNGWIVAWVDARDGNGEVYATKVSPELQRIAREERITNAPGDASDLVALANGSDVWLAWADPRGSARDGLADIYVSAVHMRDAKRSFDEQRVLATAAHSRTPRLARAAPASAVTDAAAPRGPDATAIAGRSDAGAPRGNDGAVGGARADDVLVAWIEEAPMGAATPDASGYGAYWARLGAGGKVAVAPVKMPIGGEGAASAVVFEGGLRGVIARTNPDGIALDAVDLSRSPPVASPVLMLDGPPSLDVVMVLDGDVLYFNDDGPIASDRRARRARITWNP
jgi:hypothetical protein